MKRKLEQQIELLELSERECETRGYDNDQLANEKPDHRSEFTGSPTQLSTLNRRFLSSYDVFTRHVKKLPDGVSYENNNY